MNGPDLSRLLALLKKGHISESEFNLLKESLNAKKARTFVKEDILISLQESMTKDASWSLKQKAARYDQILDCIKQGESFKKRQFFGWMKIAAVLVGLILIGSLIYLLKDSGSQQNMLSCGRDEMKILKMVDGTSIKLEANSSLIFSSEYGRKERQVKLKGDAVFSVAKNAALPFVIDLDLINIKVLGTEFSLHVMKKGEVTSYLISGKIEVNLKGRSPHRYLMRPNDSLSLRKASSGSWNLIIRQRVAAKSASSSSSASVLSSNHDTFLRFSSASLANVANELERLYGVKIFITGQTLKLEKFSATIPRKSLKEVMEILQIAGGFNYEIRDDSVFIRP